MADTIIAKIQVRRGELDDLPVLDEGEFGYAVDYRRLFIGNTPLEFVTDGTTKNNNIFSLFEEFQIDTFNKEIFNDKNKFYIT